MRLLLNLGAPPRGPGARHLGAFDLPRTRLKAPCAARLPLLRSNVCEAVRYYEQWVNGGSLRVAELAAGRRPHAAPRPCPPAGESIAEAGLCLARYDASPPLPQLDASALAPIPHVLVHGSAATKDGCAFSDIDVAVFVDDSRAFSPAQHRAAVGELRRLLHAVLEHDPLMHHGLMFASAGSLKAYDQRFLPLETLRRARVLHGDTALRVRLKKAPPADLRAALRMAALSLRRHLDAGDFLTDDYRFKSFLAGALLMPARVLAAQGSFVYKRDSFEAARELFRSAQWEFIARCEALRSLWLRPPPPLAHRLVPPWMHPRLRQIAGEELAPRVNVRRISSVMADGLASSAQLFLERVEALA